MTPTAKDSDIKWLESQIKTLATTAAGISGELSAHKKEYQQVADRVLVIETQRTSEKKQFDSVCDSIDSIDDERDKELTKLKKGYDDELTEIKDDLKEFKNKFTTPKLLGYASVFLGILLAVFKIGAMIMEATGITLSFGG